MASGTFYFETLNWEGEIRWSSTPIPGKNASTVTAAVYTDGWNAYGNYPFAGSIWIGSTRSDFTFLRLTPEQFLAGQVTATVSHDQEGKASVTIRTVINRPDGNSQIGKVLQGEKTVTLDVIQLAKPSRITFSQQEIQMGKNLLITIDRDRPDCLHTLSYSFGSQTATLGENLESSFSWKVDDLAEFCSDALSGTCTVTCKTFRGGKFLGKTKKNLTLLVPDPAKPEPASLTLGTEASFSCPRNSKNFRLNLCLVLNDKEYPVGEGKQDSFSCTPSYELALAKPDLAEFSGLIRCRTYNGTALVGQTDTPVTITVPQNEHTKPVIENLILTPILHGIPEKFGWLRGKTGLKAEMTAVSQTSQIAEYGLIAGRKQASGNPAVIEVLEDPGTLTVRAWVRDLRGFESEKTQTIEVVPYEKPRVIPYAGESAVICQRGDASGVLSPGGRDIWILAGVRHTEIGSFNSGSLCLRWKQGEEAFTDWLLLTKPGENQIRYRIPGPEDSLKHSYQVELSARDSLGESTTMAFSVMSEAISFVLYDGTDGASFGKFPELPHVVDLAPHMTLLVRGKLDLRGESWQDLGLAPGISPALPGVGRWEGCGLRLSGGNHVYLSAVCAMPGENMALNGQPVPEHLRPAGEVSSLVPSEGGCVVLTCGRDGFLRVHPVFGKQDPSWIDGYLDYFI